MLSARVSACIELAAFVATGCDTKASALYEVRTRDTAIILFIFMLQISSAGGSGVAHIIGFIKVCKILG